MKKRTFNLVTGIVGGVQAIAIAVITYVQPAYVVQINAAIVVAGTAATEICSLFVKDE